MKNSHDREYGAKTNHDNDPIVGSSNIAWKIH